MPGDSRTSWRRSRLDSRARARVGCPSLLPRWQPAAGPIHFTAQKPEPRDLGVTPTPADGDSRLRPPASPASQHRDRFVTEPPVQDTTPPPAGSSAGRPRTRRTRGSRSGERSNGVHPERDEEVGASAVGPDPPTDEEGVIRINVVDLKRRSMQELAALAEELSVENAAGMRKQDLIFAILKAQTAKRGRIYAEGVLETLPDGFGFLRAPDQNYLAGPDDIYVSPSQIRQVSAFARATPSARAASVNPKGERALLRSASRSRQINFDPPDVDEGQDPLRQPHASLSDRAEVQASRADPGRTFTTRIIDLIAPIGKGSKRALIVSPPQGRQDDDPEERSPTRSRRITRRSTADRAAHRRAPRRGDRHAAACAPKSSPGHLRRAGHTPRPASPRWSSKRPSG